jgi:hypothetical protein
MFESPVLEIVYKRFFEPSEKPVNKGLHKIIRFIRNEQVAGSSPAIGSSLNVNEIAA